MFSEELSGALLFLCSTFLQLAVTNTFEKSRSPRHVSATNNDNRGQVYNLDVLYIDDFGTSSDNDRTDKLELEERLQVITSAPFSHNQLEVALSTILTKEVVAVVGLDCEWRPETKLAGVSDNIGSGTRSRTSILQLGSCNFALVMKVLEIGRNELPQHVVSILQNEHIVKVGVNIRGDAQRIFRDFNVECKSVVDLRDLESKVSYKFNAKSRTPR